MGFLIYDLSLLVVFAIFVAIFLYYRRHNLKKEGLLLLYRTSWGIKVINYVGNKYQRTLKFLSYVSIGLGYVLMASVIYFFGRIVYIYAFHKEIVQAIKIPPIMPLIPYLPKVFHLDFLPEFPFIYWIVILAIIAITHEFAHGIFAAYNRIKIRTTGFGFFPFFLPVFLAAFVELDEEKMAKEKKLKQMAILSAGTFANVVTGVVFFVLMVLFFFSAFAPVGVGFDDYAYSITGIGNVSSVNGINLENASSENILVLMNQSVLGNLVADGKNYSGIAGFSSDGNYLGLYDDAPAINAGLVGVIENINDIKITSREKLGEELLKHFPSDSVEITALTSEGEKTYEIVLGEHPEKTGEPWLGIAFADRSASGITGRVSAWLSSFRKPNVYYESAIGEFGDFVYNLLWWIVLISISVALVNMLPVGIFDGGRFFYLTILGITGSKSKAEKSFRFVTYFFLFLLLLIMCFWALSFF